MNIPDRTYTSLSIRGDAAWAAPSAAWDGVVQTASAIATGDMGGWAYADTGVQVLGAEGRLVRAWEHRVVTETRSSDAEAPGVRLHALAAALDAVGVEGSVVGAAALVPRALPQEHLGARVRSGASCIAVQERSASAAPVVDVRVRVAEGVAIPDVGAVARALRLYAGVSAAGRLAVRDVKITETDRETVGESALASTETFRLRVLDWQLRVPAPSLFCMAWLTELSVAAARDATEGPVLVTVRRG